MMADAVVHERHRLRGPVQNAYAVAEHANATGTERRLPRTMTTCVGQPTLARRSHHGEGGRAERTWPMVRVDADRLVTRILVTAPP